MMRQAAAVFLCVFWAGVAAAQSWVQIEAQPSAARAIERAQDWAARLPEVGAYRTGTNWHAIALGPYASEDDARRRLLELRAQRIVPSDSFVTDGRGFRDQVFGSGDVIAGLAPLPDPEELEPGEETPAEARRNERDLTREDREELQVALKWEGFYNSVIDASFGPGTRRAMADWQQANGYEPTGVLTTLQRRELVSGYREAVDSLALAPVVDAKAGIEIDLPTALVEFDRYDAPFAHYLAATDDGVRVVLISQSGDANTLAALYDIIQTLEIVPMEGTRNLGSESFTIDGANDRIATHVYARRAGDAVKGYALVWPAGDESRRALALAAMQASFRTTDAVLPDTESTGVQDVDLLAGLEIRRPERSRSGFYIASDGAVLTTADAVRQCARVTLGEDVDADVAAQDGRLALLRPRQTLAPLSVARLSASEPRIASDIAVSGFSFGGILTAPSLTFGTLADVKGLDGDTDVQRLDVQSEPGDAGGPVFDGSGAVLGMLLDRDEGARQLPGDVAFAADAPVLAEFLSQNGVTPAAADPGAAMAPEDLTLLAADLTVLVSCWN
jgi:peptidoglycan hydrolase-like protein with peptidoglycan-binding domain